MTVYIREHDIVRSHNIALLNDKCVKSGFPGLKMQNVLTIFMKKKMISIVIYFFPGDVLKFLNKMYKQSHMGMMLVYFF